MTYHEPSSFTTPPDDGSTEICAKCGEERGDHIYRRIIGQAIGNEMCPDRGGYFTPDEDDRSPSEGRAEAMGDADRI